MSQPISNPLEEAFASPRTAGELRSPRVRPTVLVAVLAACLALITAGCGGSVEARLAEVQSLHDAGDFSSTIEPLRKILATEPDNAQANYLYGLALVQTRQPSLSIWPLRKAADSQEYAVSAGVLLASTLVGMEGFEEARKAADGVLEAEADNLFALQVRANANIGMGAHEEALLDAERVADLEPEMINGYALKAMALSMMDRRDDAVVAIQDLRRVAKATDNRDGQVRGCVSLSTFYRSAPNEEDNELDKALATVRECLEDFPTEPMILAEGEAVLDPAEKGEEATQAYRDAVAAKPEDIGFRFLLANRLGSHGQVEEAEQILTEAADLFKDARAYDQLARFYQVRGEFDKARDATQQAIGAEGADNEALRFRQAELMIELGDIEGAEEMAAQLQESVFQDLIQGRLLVAKGDDKGGLAVFEKALVSWPNNAAARYLAGAAAERLGLVTKALSHYRESLRADSAATDASLAAARLHLANGEYEEAQQLAIRQIQNRSERRAEARIVAARAATALADYDGARRHLLPVKRLDGYQATYLVERAAIERAAGDVSAAVAVVDAGGLDLTQTENMVALRSLADDMSSLGRSSEALAKVDAAVAANPGSAELLDLQARTRFVAGDKKGAAESFRAALKAEPDFGPAAGGLARLVVEDGDVDGGLALLRQAIAADPTDGDSGHLAAQLLLQQGKKAEAVAMLRSVLDHSPGSAFAANDLAWILAEDGEDLDYALSIAQRAARLNPRPEILDTLGYVQHKTGDDPAAVATYRRVLEASPEAASTRYRMGLSLEASGRSDEALAEFRKALESGAFPESDQARAQVARLESAR